MTEAQRRELLESLPLHLPPVTLSWTCATPMRLLPSSARQISTAHG
jgi:hypothetical protein